MQIRREEPQDSIGIAGVLKDAFPTASESQLVEMLRTSGNLAISLVGTLDSEIIGYIAFSPVTLDGTSMGLGLAPLAVNPGFRSRGYGGRLVEAGLEKAREAATPFVVVLGDPSYYHRFGFRPAAHWNLRDEYGGGEAFQAVQFIEDSIQKQGGLVKYGREFGALADETPPNHSLEPTRKDDVD